MKRLEITYLATAFHAEKRVPVAFALGPIGSTINRYRPKPYEQDSEKRRANLQAAWTLPECLHAESLEPRATCAPSQGAKVQFHYSRG